METKYIIISPDGFPIHMEEYIEDNEVLNYFTKWKKRYERQGYYSSVKYGRIPLEELDDYCIVEKIRE